MKNILFLFISVASAVVLAGSPKVTGVSMTQDNVYRTVTISYVLSEEPAVITLSVETNAGENVWAPIKANDLGALAGNCNVLVQPDAHEFKWQPYLSAISNTIANCRVAVTAWATNAPPDYMVVDPTGSVKPHYYVSAEAVPGGVGDNRYKSQYILMRRIHAAGAEWLMGQDIADNLDTPHRALPHAVVLSKDYYIGVYETTQGQYSKFSGGVNPSTHKNYADSEYRPVESLTERGYDPINAGLLDTIGTLAAQSGIAFTLPTEAQWEFAARAGSTEELPNGKATEANADVVAVWNKNAVSPSGLQTAVVGTKAPNAFGLYDVIGNVWEICRDGWKAAYSDGSDAVDPCTPDAESTSEEAYTTCKNGTTDCPGYHSRRGGSYENRNFSYLRFNGRYSCEWRDTWWGAKAGCGFRLCAPCEAK